MTSYRMDHDALGEVKVPQDALWGASTQRALENFPISTRRFPRAIIGMLGLVKAHAAAVNRDLHLVSEEIALAIERAALDVAQGLHDHHFPLDVFQTGSGTSLNMNANEVIANLANLALGSPLGSMTPVHPNDHVNRCQSSNDVIPSVIHLAAATEIDRTLLPALERLHSALVVKAKAFDSILKIGRTHLQDAMPIRLGQEFGGYARQVEMGIERLRRLLTVITELALGGTAVGTGTGSHPQFASRVCERLASELMLDFRPSVNSFTALASQAPAVEASSDLSATAVSLTRIADDIRLLASGPRLGLGEIKLPSLQPGSSIMPGKVNPVIPEVVCQVGTQVLANATAISIAATAGHLQLNTQLPLIASNLLESISILASAARVFAEKCVEGIEANQARCESLVEQSLALATALVPKIGYAKASEIAKEAARSNRTIREVALEQNIAPKEELDVLLDLHHLTTHERTVT